MRGPGRWLPGVVILSLACAEEPEQRRAEEPEHCRDVPSRYYVNLPNGSMHSLYYCNWAADSLTWACEYADGGLFGAMLFQTQARYRSQADFVSEHVPGVVRAVETHYRRQVFSNTGTGASASESTQYTYDDQQRLRAKTVQFSATYRSATQHLEQHQEQRFTFWIWDKRGRPILGEYSSTWTSPDGTTPYPPCADTFRMSYDEGEGRITRTAGSQGCSELEFSFSTREFGVAEFGERVLRPSWSLDVFATQHFCEEE